MPVSETTSFKQNFVMCIAKMGYWCMADFGGEFLRKGLTAKRPQNHRSENNDSTTFLLHSVWPQRFIRPLWNLAMRDFN